VFFTSIPAVLTLFGVSFRLWETAIVSYYQPKYYGVYKKQYSLYNNIMAPGGFIASFLANIMSGVVVEFF
jgi:hypothetical protein